MADMSFMHSGHPDSSLMYVHIVCTKVASLPAYLLENLKLGVQSIVVDISSRILELVCLTDHPADYLYLKQN